MKKRVLITGADGFIGRNLVKSLENCQHDVIALHRNTRDLRSEAKNVEYLRCDLLKEKGVMEPSFITSTTGLPSHYGAIGNVEYLPISHIGKLFKPDIVVHLAANADPSTKDFLENNIISTQKLCEACKGADRFILASSVVVYDQEEMLKKPAHEFSPVKPQSLYGVSKLSCENIVQLPQFEFESVDILRLCATIGHVETLTHGALRDLHQKVRDALDRKGKTKDYYTSPPEMEAWGERPGSFKPYVHVDDVIALIKQLIYETGVNEDRVEITNVSAHDRISIEKIIRTIEEHMSNGEQKIKIKWNAEKVSKGDNPVLNIDNESFREYTNKEYSSKDAIKKAIGAIKL